MVQKLQWILLWEWLCKSTKSNSTSYDDYDTSGYTMTLLKTFISKRLSFILCTSIRRSSFSGKEDVKYGGTLAQLNNLANKQEPGDAVYST